MPIDGLHHIVLSGLLLIAILGIGMLCQYLKGEDDEPSRQTYDLYLASYYLEGKKFAYKNINTLEFCQINTCNPYDCRTREGKAWKLGFANAYYEHHSLIFHSAPKYCKEA